MISTIMIETVNFDKGYYCGVYVLLQFKMEYGFDRKEEQADIEAYMDQEEMNYIVVYD